nr:unnamed protein product [Callosobruchus chinensis]
MKSQSNPTSSIIPPKKETIKPLPKTACQQKKSKPAQNAADLTSTTYKAELKAEKAKIKHKKVIRVKRKVTVVKENEGNEQKNKKIDFRLFEPSTSKTNIDINLDEWYCYICDEKIAEGMIQCCQCGT